VTFEFLLTTGSKRGLNGPFANPKRHNRRTESRSACPRGTVDGSKTTNVRARYKFATIGKRRAEGEENGRNPSPIETDHDERNRYGILNWPIRSNLG